jgi:hypothetical protein
VPLTQSLKPWTAVSQYRLPRKLVIIPAGARLSIRAPEESISPPPWNVQCSRSIMSTSGFRPVTIVPLEPPAALGSLMQLRSVSVWPAVRVQSPVTSTPAYSKIRPANVLGPSGRPKR